MQLRNIKKCTGFWFFIFILSGCTSQIKQHPSDALITNVTQSQFNLKLVLNHTQPYAQIFIDDTELEMVTNNTGNASAFLSDYPSGEHFLKIVTNQRQLRARFILKENSTLHCTGYKILECKLSITPTKLAST